MKTTVSAIIIHWNTPELLERQLSVVTKNSSDVEILVVDNNSEKSIGRLKRDFPNVKFIENKKNLGFAAACNVGARNAKGDWLLFLNPDVEITTEQIQKMVDLAKQEELDACSPTTTDTSTTRAFDSWFSNLYEKPLPTSSSLLVEFTPLNRVIPPKLFKKKALFGGCLMIRAKVLKEVGEWDEDFFLWFEDSDLTQRLLDKNYRVGWVQVKIKHKGAASFSKLEDKERKKIFFNSMSLYAKKHFGPGGRFIAALLKQRYV